MAYQPRHKAHCLLIEDSDFDRRRLAHVLAHGARRRVMYCTSENQIIYHAPGRDRFAAFEQPCGNKNLLTVADRTANFTLIKERPYELDHFRVLP